MFLFSRRMSVDLMLAKFVRLRHVEIAAIAEKPILRNYFLKKIQAAVVSIIFYAKMKLGFRQPSYLLTISIRVFLVKLTYSVKRYDPRKKRPALVLDYFLTCFLIANLLHL